MGRRTPFLAGLLVAAVLVGACTATEDDADRPAETTSVPDGGPVPEPGPEPGDPDPADDERPPPEITWDETCAAGARCGAIEVPLDHDEPDGRQIEVTFTLVPAAEPDQRIGLLFVNPGGPGAPASGLAEAAPYFLPTTVVDHFDVVGVDSRGTGGTIPIDCGDDLDAIYALDPTPDDRADERERDRVGRGLAERCVEESGDWLSHVSTEATARDLDLVRAALDEEQLSFMGYSYGTYLGGQYADLFPDRVRAMVLDGAVDPTLDAVEQFTTQAAGGEVALEAFLDGCLADGCPFAATSGATDLDELLDAFDDLMADLDAEPLPTDAGPELGPGEAHLGVFGALFSVDRWDPLGRALADAADGDGSGLYDLFADYVSQERPGRYGDISDAYWAIGVADGLLPVRLEDFEEIVEAEPRLGPAIVAENLMGAYWPEVPRRDLAPFRARGAEPILVISTTRDPSTPYQAGVDLAEQLSSGVLVTYDGDGHTVYASGRSACIDRLVNDYLVDLVVPSEGTEC